MKSSILSLLFGVAIVACQSAHASVLTVQQTLDVTQPMSAPPLRGWQSSPPFSGGVNITLAAGDTLDYTIDFAGDQSLSVHNLSLVWAFIYADTTSEVTGTGMFQFLDAAGLPFLSSSLLTDTEGDVHFGQNFSNSAFAGGLPTDITFYGVRYVGTIDQYLNSAVSSRNYNDPAFYFTADNVTVNNASVPEPSTFAILGISLVGLIARRNRRIRARE